MTNFPSSLDNSTTLPVESANTPLSTNHLTAHQNIQDALEAVEAKVGVAVSAANDYDVIVDAEGASWGSSFKNTYNLPANNTDVNFVAVVYFNGSWTTATSGSPVGGIVSVTTQA